MILKFLEHTLSMAGFLVWLTLVIAVALAGLLRIAHRKHKQQGEE
jgi:hypothetical protein